MFTSSVVCLLIFFHVSLMYCIEFRKFLCAKKSLSYKCKMQRLFCSIWKQFGHAICHRYCERLCGLDIPIHWSLFCVSLLVKCSKKWRHQYSLFKIFSSNSYIFYIRNLEKTVEYSEELNVFLFILEKFLFCFYCQQA